MEKKWTAGLSAALVTCLVPVETRAQTDSVAADTTGAFQAGTVRVLGQSRLGRDRVLPAQRDDADPRGDVAHALQSVPGTTLTFGGNRNETQVYVRGFDSRQVAMFLDGVPIYVPYDGNVDLARFFTADLSEISVDKYSSLSYGPNGMGGVVNLISRTPREGFETSGQIGLRGVNGQEGRLRLGWRSGDWYALGNGEFLRRPSWSVSEDFTPTKYENGGERLNSRTWDRAVGGKLGWSPSQDREIALTVSDQHGEKGVPVYAGESTTSSMYKYWSWPYWEKTSVYGIARWRLDDQIAFRAPVYWDRFANSLYAYDDTSYSTQKKKSSWRSDYDDHSAGGSFILDFSEGADTARVFAHFKQDVHDEGNTTNDTASTAGVQAFVDKPRLRFEDRTVSVGVEGYKDLGGGLSFTPGVSWTRRQADQADSLVDLGSYKYQVVSFSTLMSAAAVDAQARLRWAVAPGHELTASLSSRTRMPTIKERYSFKLGTAIPNPSLAPERSLQASLSWAARPLPGLSLEASLWEAWLSDVIMDVNVSTSTTQSQNRGKARYGGWEWSKTSTFALPAPELSARWSLPWKAPGLAKASVSGAYSYIQRRNLDSAELRFVNVPEHQVTGSVTWGPLPFLDLVWTTQAASSRQSHSDGSYVVEAFAVSHAKVEARWKSLTLEAGLQNVFDADYEICEGFPEEGRVGYASIGWDLGL